MKKILAMREEIILGLNIQRENTSYFSTTTQKSAKTGLRI